MIITQKEVSHRRLNFDFIPVHIIYGIVVITLSFEFLTGVCIVSLNTNVYSGMVYNRFV